MERAEGWNKEERMNTRKHLKVLNGSRVCLWSNKVRVERQVVCIRSDQQGLESTSVQVTGTLASRIWVRVLRTCFLISFKYITHFSLTDTDVKARMRWILAFETCSILYFVVVSCFLRANKVILSTVFTFTYRKKTNLYFFGCSKGQSSG